MKMKLYLAKLEKYLSEEERAEIEAFPTPSINQANNVFRIVRDEIKDGVDIKWLLNNLPWLKLYIKCARVYPELLF